MKIKTSQNFIIVAIAAISLSSAFAQLPYDVYKNDLDMYQGYPQIGPVRESFNIAGFTLTVNQLHIGYTVYSKPIGNVLGLLHGDDFDVHVRYITSSKIPLQQLAVQMRSGTEVVKTIAVHNNFGLKGLRATYSVKTSFLSQYIKVMRYFFVNQAGQTICFSARATNTNPDYTYFEYLMTQRLAPLGVKENLPSLGGSPPALRDGF